MKIENINTGVCHSRVQLDKPPFFVNWTEDGVNKYKFFSLVFACEDFKNSLLRLQTEYLIKQAPMKPKFFNKFRQQY